MSHLELPEGHRENESTATKALNTLRNEAVTVRDTVVEHKSSTALLLGIVGVAAFLIGHAAGYRKAEAEIVPPGWRFW